MQCNDSSNNDISKIFDDSHDVDGHHHYCPSVSISTSLDDDDDDLQLLSNGFGDKTIFRSDDSIHSDNNFKFIDITTTPTNSADIITVPTTTSSSASINEVDSRNQLSASHMTETITDDDISELLLDLRK